jgi:hypothetical protein
VQGVKLRNSVDPVVHHKEEENQHGEDLVVVSGWCGCGLQILGEAWEEISGQARIPTRWM